MIQKTAGIIKILIIENKKQLDLLTFNNLLHILPQNIQQDILKYKKWQDRQARLLGKWLLIKGLKLLGENPNRIETLQKDFYKRPFLSNSQTKLNGKLDFNISHSKGIVICALGMFGKIGIDVELIHAIIPSHYKTMFTQQELENIQNSTTILPTFFRYWTRKEAIMKADGRGFYLPPASFETIEDKAIVEGKIWYLKEININTFIERQEEDSKYQYSCHLATSQPVIAETHFIKGIGYL